MTLDETRLARLYELLARLEREGSADEAAALRWAIYRLETGT